MKIGIYGANGYVGRAMCEFFSRKYTVLKYDPNLGTSSPFEDIDECDLGVICVPTKMNEDGSCDTSIVEETVKKSNCRLLLCKSTVAPGTTDALKEKYGKRIVFSPEYIGESGYWIPDRFPHPTEVVRHSFQIFGGDPKDCSEMVDIFVCIVGPSVFFYQVNAKTAEVIKYWENSWFAAKIVFANEMKEICDAFGVDFWAAREGWGLDPRVEKMHSAVFKDKRGYSGKCLPKDISALVKASEKAGYDPKFLKQIILSNAEFNKKNI